MSDDKNFKEPYSGWWFLASVAVLIAISCMHIITGWFTFWF
ncbi:MULTISPECIES: hypothetical protein [Salinimonas]|nr:MULTISPECIES: hypothetical protein [Salinimonas]